MYIFTEERQQFIIDYQYQCFVTKMYKHIFFYIIGNRYVAMSRRCVNKKIVCIQTVRKYGHGLLLSARVTLNYCF